MNKKATEISTVIYQVSQFRVAQIIEIFSSLLLPSWKQLYIIKLSIRCQQHWAFYILIPFNLHKPHGRHYYSCFIDEEAEAQRKEAVCQRFQTALEIGPKFLNMVYIFSVIFFFGSNSNVMLHISQKCGREWLQPNLLLHLTSLQVGNTLLLQLLHDVCKNPNSLSSSSSHSSDMLSCYFMLTKWQMFL